MKLEDAPPPGWYPDPRLSGQLRWWEGADWADDRRAIPTASELAAAVQPQESAPPAPVPGSGPDPRLRREDTDQIVDRVRAAAREEVDRAADLFSQRVRSATNRARGVVAHYVDTVLRWLRIAIVAAAIAVIVWFVLQIIFQATLLDWLGDRIDNIGD